MIDNRYSDSLIFRESDDSFKHEFFNFTKSKIIHAIDTFYYSVTFAEDFSGGTAFKNVLKFRDWLRLNTPADYSSHTIVLDGFPYAVQLKKSNYAARYFYRFSLDDYFDIFYADTMNNDGITSNTPQCVVQLRSYYLWSRGVAEAVRESFEFVRILAKRFDLHIFEVKENRCDYCFHSNYHMKPEKFLDREYLYKSKVSHFNSSFSHDHGIDENDYEIDYVSFGSRSGSHFIRIYLKSKEVVEMGYKPYFLKVWLLEGLISRYDFYVLEDCLMHKSWKYMSIARLRFYYDYGKDDGLKIKCKDYIDTYNTSGVVPAAALQLADDLTPQVHKIMNFEFQLMRSGSKSYQLIDFDSLDHNDLLYNVNLFLANHDLIVDFLTSKILRFVDFTANKKKCLCPDTDFWQRLRSASFYNNKPNEKIVREYHRQMNEELRKGLFMKKAISAAACLGSKQDNNSMQLALETLLRMNDNDIKRADRYKCNYPFPDVLTDYNDFGELVIMDKSTGQVYDFG